MLYREFAVVISNRKIVFVLKWKHVSSLRFHWPSWYLMLHCFVLMLCGLDHSFYLVFMFTQYMDSYDSKHVLFHVHVVFVQLVKCFICSGAGTIIILPFMAIPSMIAISSLNDQYGSFHTSTFVDGQPCNTYTDCMSKCSSPRVDRLFLHFSCCQVCPCMTITFMVMHTLVFPHLLLSCGCIWIANLLQIVVALVCTGFFCCIGVCIAIPFAICVIGLLHISWRLPPAVCGL